VSSCVLLTVRVIFKIFTLMVNWCSLNGTVNRGVVWVALGGQVLAMKGNRRVGMLVGVLGWRLISEFKYGLGEGE